MKSERCIYFTLVIFNVSKRFVIMRISSAMASALAFLDNMPNVSMRFFHQPGESTTALLERADQSLYRAKAFRARVQEQAP